MLLKISYISNCMLAEPKVKTVDINNMYSCLNAMSDFLSEEQALNLWWDWIRITDYPDVKRVGNVELELVEK